MKKRMGGVSLYLVLILILVVAIKVFNPPATTVPEKNFTQFVNEIQSDNLKSVKFDGRNAVYKTKDDKTFETVLPEEARQSFYNDYLKDKVDKKEVDVIGTPAKETPFYVDLLPNILLLGLFAFFWFYLIKQSQGGGSKVGNFGKSKAKLIKEDDKNLVNFSQVAGLQEEKEELGEIVDFLKNPKKFTEMGARIPKGVLLVGPPGTGKTYLSKAVAGEAKVPFFIMSGSDFVEMFVGVGASRVRDLFETAKKNAPCIIFIDEIDAVGRKRGAGLGGGHDEREQTLNQLLVEMDGFGKNEGVIVMAATNRADILDPALLRPGRFDRQIFVDVPDVKGREQILKIHSKNKHLAEDVDLKYIAKRTAGFTPADLENLMNEAALLAARRNNTLIHREDVEEAEIKVQAGPAKKSRVVSDASRRLTAVHEAGHAVVSTYLENSDPVHMITIIPRGRAGGFTAYTPEDDDDFITKRQMEDRIVSLLGGRVAEQIVLKDISTGASNDIERATRIAKSMVTRYGMSESIGTVTYGSDEDEVFIGRDLGRSKDYSENTAAKIDAEVSKIVNDAYKKAEELLSSNISKLMKVADSLLEKETLNKDEFMAIINGEEEVTEPKVIEEYVENMNENLDK